MLETAVRLLALPRILSEHLETPAEPLALLLGAEAAAAPAAVAARAARALLALPAIPAGAPPWPPPCPPPPPRFFPRRRPPLSRDGGPPPLPQLCAPRRWCARPARHRDADPQPARGPVPLVPAVSPRSRARRTGDPVIASRRDKGRAGGHVGGRRRATRGGALPRTRAPLRGGSRLPRLPATSDGPRDPGGHGAPGGAGRACGRHPQSRRHRDRRTAVPSRAAAAPRVQPAGPAGHAAPLRRLPRPGRARRRRGTGAIAG